MQADLSAPTTLESPRRTRAMGVIAGVVLFAAAAGYVVGAAARRLTSDGVRLESALTIAVVTVLAGVLVVDRLRAARSQQAG